MAHEYDVAIIGAGVAGSSLALVLAKAGLRCFVVEKGRHPRFVIGESTVPSTSWGFEYLSKKYGVPEFSAITHYTGLKEAGCRGWPKQHFWFGFNEPGQPVRPEQELSLFTFFPPRGPDVHALRADLDHYFVKQFPKYDIEYRDGTAVIDIETSAEGARLLLSKDEQQYEVTASFVVDCSGHSSFLAKKHGLRKADPGFCTNTRSMFSHFRGVAHLDDVLEPNHKMGVIRDGGTVHHCFDGGWIWSIRFDDEITSVGITLDRDRWPLDESISAEDEFRAIIDRYPTVKAVLGDIEATRPIIRTDRIQFSSKSIVGERFVLAPHAAGFIDPLFSTGILLTQAFIARFVPLAVAAKRDGDWSAERFRCLEPVFFNELHNIDKLVGGMFRAWRHDHEVFAHYWRAWIYSGIFMYLCRVSIPQEDTTVGLYGAGVPTVQKLLDTMHAIVFDDQLGAREKAERMKATMEEVWGPFDIDWPLPLKEPIVVNWRVGDGNVRKAQLGLLAWWRKQIAQNPVLQERVEHGRFARWFWETRRRAKEHQARIEESRAKGGVFHRAYDIFGALTVGAVPGKLTGSQRLIWSEAGSSDAAETQPAR